MITVAGKVRDVMGVDRNLGIDDVQIRTLIGVAEKVIMRELFIYHYDETPENDPNSGSGWDGSNTSFVTSEYPVVDKDFDNSTVDDVIAKYWDSDNAPQDATCVVSNARYGRITITTDGSTPIPNNAKKLLVEYYSMEDDIPFGIMEELGTYLTAHLITIRLSEPRKISIADLESNRSILQISDNTYIREYKRLLRQYQKPMMGSTEVL